MHRIDNVEVDGFWGDYSFGFPLLKDVTFLIGPNGTGKTTLVNLIAAALTADFRALDRIPFKRITIKLNKIGRTDEPTIIVTKSRRKERTVEQIDYRIRSGKPGTSEHRFELSDTEENLYFRRLTSDHRAIQDYYRRASIGISRHLRELVNVTWLTVQRTSSAPDRSESFDSPIDIALENQSNLLVRHFATLSARKDERVRSFQEFIFASLLDSYSGPQMLKLGKQADIGKYEEALQSIFKELHVDEQSAGILIGSYLNRVDEVRKAYLKKRKAKKDDGLISSSDAEVMMGLARVDAVIDRWEKLQDELSHIFSQRDKFVDILNALLQRKRVEISASNELQFVSRTGKLLPRQVLSSGEKQLLILLGEMLLQSEKAYVFIADEPELSLHVLWQEKLIASLRTLNPAAQIVAATHSPDIVGSLSEQIVDMEALIP